MSAIIDGPIKNKAAVLAQAIIDSATAAGQTIQSMTICYCAPTQNSPGPGSVHMSFAADPVTGETGSRVAQLLDLPQLPSPVIPAQ